MMICAPGLTRGYFSEIVKYIFPKCCNFAIKALYNINHRWKLSGGIETAIIL